MVNWFLEFLPQATMNQNRKEKKNKSLIYCVFCFAGLRKWTATFVTRLITGKYLSVRQKMRSHWTRFATFANLFLAGERLLLHNDEWWRNVAVTFHFVWLPCSFAPRITINFLELRKETNESKFKRFLGSVGTNWISRTSPLYRPRQSS